VGMVFQSYALWPHMKVKENIGFGLRVQKLPRREIEARVASVLDDLAMGGLGERYPSQLSGGQQQRVALARLLATRPPVFLMDEPLSNLDARLRMDMRSELKRFHHDADATTVYVTHDQSEALTMSNRIAVFDDGVIQQLATPNTLYEKPENAFVAGFIGENNRLMGRVTEMNGQSCSVEVDAGGSVQALAINVDGVGTRTTLSLRPERVMINPAEGSCPNVFDAKVEELIYLGDHMRTRVSVCGRDDFIVKVPNSSGNIDLTPGEMVKVGWMTEDCRALDARE
ncbi:MAG: ABC transporter ATP-binding protein, partial [Alphaproteobacteria bacterium]